MGYFRDTLKGMGWMGGFRVFSRLIALGRTAILARLLLPAQFGVYGIATLVLAFLEIFTETGVNVFLIQEKKDIDGYINTAWVVSIFRGILISLIVILIAPIIVSFFNSPDVRPLILLISLVPFFRGIINPSIIKFRKELQFNKEFWFRSAIFLLSSSVAITLALITRSVTSLIWGLVAGAMFEAVLSFIMVKPAPKFVFEIKKAKKIISRGKWVTFAGIFAYLARQGDDAVVAKILNPISLGFYQMAYRISTLPITEVSDVAGKVIFPVYVKISGDRERLKKAYIKSLLAISALVVPIGLVLFLFPEELILIVLGNNWLQAAPVLKVLAVFGVIRAISGSGSALFLGLNRQEFVARITLVRFLGLAVSIVPLTIKFGIVGAAYSSLVSVSIALPVIAYHLFSVLRKNG